MESSNPTSTSVLPLILRGKDLGPLLGTAASKLSAFTCREGRPKPLVFQVDEFNAAGRVVSAESDPSLAKDEQPGVLDATDEIAFLLQDLQDECPAEILDKVRGKLAALEVTAKYLKKPAAAYLVAAEKGFIPSESYVSFDPKTQTVSTSAYEWGYRGPDDFLYTKNILRDLRTHPRDDVFDRLKVRFTVKAVGKLMTFHMNEEEISSKVVTLRAGPVRLLREMDLDISIAGITIQALVTFIHYERLWQAYVRFKLPKPAALFTSSMDVALIHDFTGLQGVSFSTSALPQGTAVDGRMIEQDRNIAFGPEPWCMLTGNGLNYVLAIDLDRELKLTAAAAFADTGEPTAPPEEVSGGFPEVGYQFLGWENLQARWYSFSAHVGILSGFPEGGGGGFYRAVHTPLSVKVTLKDRP